MNLVRLALICGCLLIAAYAISIYAAIPTPTLASRTIETTCVVRDTGEGTGMVIVAIAGIGSALAVAITDLIRRVY